MISTTLSDYKANYQANLEAFIKGYEDNTETIFLQNELEKYNNILEILINHKATSVSFGFQTLGFQTLGEYYNSLELKNIGIDLEKPQNYITSIKRIIEFITENDNSIGYNNETIKKVRVTKYKSSLWFKVGLLFARGELNKYYNQNKTGFKSGYSAPKVAAELGNDKYDKNILATVNNYPKENSNAVKNIYNSKDKMDKIINHCNDNNTVIDEYFLSRLPLE
jgi:hypothetical protein